MSAEEECDCVILENPSEKDAPVTRKRRREAEEMESQKRELKKKATNDQVNEKGVSQENKDESKKKLVKVDIIEKIKELSNNVWLLLGPGYSESIYHNALETELRINNILYESERILPIFYKGFNVGNVRPDIVIVDRLVIELKSVLKLTEDAKIQTKSYSSELKIPGILINFPSRYGDLEIIEFKVDKEFVYDSTLF